MYGSFAALPLTCSLLLACASAPTASPPPPATGCAALDEAACIGSGDCTLEPAGETDGYRCRDAANSCEEGFAQKDGTKESCESKQACRFDPGRCYCPPDVVCICGGGPPPSCRPADGSSASS